MNQSLTENDFMRTLLPCRNITFFHRCIYWWWV